ncbi:MAG: hypothetical protein KJ648_07470 [Candidatus Omnitrophica bacterium]|nr:hypothetical protein [Candidatus Omnitrophota bacterium]
MDTRSMFATVHNAARCTFDGRDCWIACVTQVNGQLLYGPNSYISEHATQPEALAALARVAQERGLALVVVPSTGARL